MYASSLHLSAEWTKGESRRTWRGREPQCAFYPRGPIPIVWEAGSSWDWSPLSRLYVCLHHMKPKQSFSPLNKDLWHWTWGIMWLSAKWRPKWNKCILRNLVLVQSCWSDTAETLAESKQVTSPGIHFCWFTYRFKYLPCWVHGIDFCRLTICVCSALWCVDFEYLLWKRLVFPINRYK